MSSDRAPVALFAYNRPHHLARTLEALAGADGASGTALHVFCDGAKPGQDRAPIDEVRAVVRDPCWHDRFAAMEIVEAPVNRGLAASIITGVSGVLERRDRVIVLEDDLLVAPDFLEFMNACLDFYRDDPRIGSVTGFSPLAAPPAGYAHDVMAVPRNCSHGWATWADRWSEVDWEMTAAPRVLGDAALRRRLDAAGSDRSARLRRQIAGQIDSWSIRFGLWQALDERMTIYPVANRVRNIGFDGSGRHTRSGEEINAAFGTRHGPLRLEPVAEDPAVLAAFRAIYSGSLLGRLKRRLKGIEANIRTRGTNR